MKKALANLIIENLNDMGEFGELYKGYSGRGMYGKTTFGVVCSNPMRVADALASAYQYGDDESIERFNDEYEEEETNYFEKLSFDNLGNDYIVY